MEKFQKYCLSVLLVIICGNISAQIMNGSLEPNEYKNLCEIYTQLLDAQDSGNSHKPCTAKKTKYYHSIHQKQNAIGVIGKAFCEKEYGKTHYDEFPPFSLKGEIHNIVLGNFENSNKNSFTGTLYFKTKVSKIRNKDYLDVIG